MAYNKASEERKWRYWKEQEEKKLRELGMDEEKIRKLRQMDWEDFLDSVYEMLDRMEKKPGVKITPHMLRHYFANMRKQAGWELEMISQALGHKHLDTTIQYLDWLDDELIEASNEFYAQHTAIYGAERLLE